MAKMPKTDSIAHTEERHAKMQAESDEQALEREVAEEERKEKQAERDRKSREEETKFLTQQAGLIQEGETRDHLLERIRQMREEKPAEPVGVLGMSAFQQSIREIEEEAGRQAVAKAERLMEEARKTREAAEQERLKREGEMQTVHHPNPSQTEQFPASKATLGKIKK